MAGRAVAQGPMTGGRAPRRPWTLATRALGWVTVAATCWVAGPTAHAQTAPAPAPSAPAAAPAPAPPPDQSISTERTVGIVLLASGGAGIATGIVFGVLSVVEHRRSRDAFQQVDEDEDVSDELRTEYQDAVDARDDLRVGSGIAAGVGLGMFLVAGALFAIDDERGAEAATPESDAALRPRFTPHLAPGSAGASATLPF